MLSMHVLLNMTDTGYFVKLLQIFFKDFYLDFLVFLQFLFFKTQWRGKFSIELVVSSAFGY